MGNWIGRLVAAVVAAVLSLLFAPVAEASSLTSAELPLIYVYDIHHPRALVAGEVPERGPPVVHDSNSTDSVNGRRSLGDLARPGGTRTTATHAYSDLGQVAQIAHGIQGAEERVSGPPAALVEVERSSDAAKTADEAVPLITKPYVRPGGATTPAQRAAVQGKECVDCGALAERQVADHIDPLVKEYYRTGTIDLQRMRSIEAVQPQCPTCSARQGADLSRCSREMRQQWGLDP